MTDLATAVPIVSIIAGGVILLATFARDPKADEHDLSDYKPTLAPARRNWPLVDRQAADDDVIWGRADDILPPAPEGMNAGSPLYAEALFRHWYPESPEQTAARMLRELRDDALAGAR